VNAELQFHQQPVPNGSFDRALTTR